MRGYDKIAQGSAEIEASTTLSSDFQREFVLQRDKPGYRESEDSLCSAYSGYYIAYRGLNVSTLQYRSDACSTAYLTASYPFLLNLTCKLLEVAVGARCGAGRGQRFCFVFSATIVFSQLPRPVEVCGPFQAGVRPPFCLLTSCFCLIRQKLAVSLLVAHFQSVMLHAVVLPRIVRLLLLLVCTG
jgi:hypothetical protein